jgi:hypothetical protein
LSRTRCTEARTDGSPRRRPRAAGVVGAEQARSNRCSPFDVVELQRSRDGVEHALGGAADLAAFELGVVVDADAGEHGDLFAAQTGHAPFAAVVGQARLLGGHVRPAGDQELPHLVLPAHILP